jgi:acetylornithine deacetylase
MGDDLIDLLATLVSIDSVNPSLVPGAAGESRIAARVASWARDNGLTAQVVEGTSGRPSVIVRGGQGDGPTLLLCGHLDTVGTGGVTDPFTPRVEGDRLYGRGAYDMKGGLAAALVACRDAARAGIAGEVVVAAVADEEHASLGVQEALRHVRADAAIVTEPTELRVATAHKGFVWTEIEVTGRSAHGSRPHLGIDAIMKSGPILRALDELNRELATRRVHPSLGPGSLHASLIAGGREESTIPDRCLLTVERRTLPGETLAGVEAEVGRLLERCRDADEELTVAARTTLDRDPFETGPDERIVQAVQDALDGADPAPVGVSYWADSAFIARAGIPTVVFGPNGDGAHAEVEWVSVSGTVTCTRLLTTAARSFCRDDPADGPE